MSVDRPTYPQLNVSVAALSLVFTSLEISPFDPATPHAYGKWSSLRCTRQRRTNTCEGKRGGRGRGIRAAARGMFARPRVRMCVCSVQPSLAAHVFFFFFAHNGNDGDGGGGGGEKRGNGAAPLPLPPPPPHLEYLMPISSLFLSLFPPGDVHRRRRRTRRRRPPNGPRVARSFIH